MTENASTAELKQRARAGDAAALQALRDRGFFAKATPDAPLSAAQRRLWVIDRMMPGSPLYNIATALRLDGPLDRAALAAAVRVLLERHEPLRTIFREIEGESRQVIGAPDPAAWREIDVIGAAVPADEARPLARREAEAPFDLARGPLFRAVLVRMAPDRHLLLCTMHHIVSDAWSAGVIQRELTALYAAFAAGRPNPLAPLRGSYRDYARQQQQNLDGAEGVRCREYWLRRLGGERTTLALPTDFRRPAVQTASGRLHRFSFDAGMSQALIQLGRAQGATPFMVLLALVKTLLMRYSGQSDICVGTPVAGRDRIEWEGLVGFFVNTVVVRDSVAPTDTFAQLLERVRDTCVEALDHQAYPFDRLVDDLKLPRDFSRSPLFDVSVQLLEGNSSGAKQLGELALSEFDHGFAPAKCDLSFDFAKTEAGFECSLTYHADLFAESRMRRLEQHLRELATGVIADPGRALGAYNLLTPAERQQLLVQFNPAPRELPQETLTGWLGRVAASQPDATAVCCGPHSRSFAELENEASAQARRLKALGIGRETVVGVLMERGVAWATAMVAIMKAGGVYLPLDPGLPRARIEFMLQDSGATLVLTTGALAARAGLAPSGGEVFAGDLLAWRGPFASERETGTAEPAPEDAAYLIYTSGSTGEPKGVVVEHRGIVNTVRDQIRQLRLSSMDRVLQFASASFDASLFEIWNAWLGGATLVIAPDALRTDRVAFLALLRTERVAVAVLPPSFVRSLERAPLPLRLLFTAGEAAVTEDARHYAVSLMYVNGYGPTEASICSSVHIMTSDAATVETVPIGRPIANTRAYVLDGQGGLAPIGVPGELAVAGAGVARGYWRRPALTAERFVPDPWAGGRMYRTGDLCRWREDGVLEFLGRIDTQVKLRGFRIELGEIETALTRCAGVREAAVALRADEPANPLLVGYVVPAAGATVAVEVLRRELRERLPEYMVPGAFVVLDALPLSTAGKVDRRRLPAPAFTATAVYVAPRNDVERAIAGIMAEVLRQPRVGVDDAFFQIGGNSLLAIQVISRLRDTLKAEITVPQFFEHPSIAGLAGLLLADPAQSARVEKVAQLVVRLAAMTPEQREQLLARARASAGSRAANAPGQ